MLWTTKKKYDYKLSNQEIQKEDKTKFLGIIIDQRLTWKNRIDYIVTKISKILGTLCRILFLICQSATSKSFV